MDYSKIGWTDHTWNPWQGCEHVSPACKFCYIGPIMKRAGRVPFDGPNRAKTTWKKPFRWQRNAQTEGHRFRVFTCSLSDFFHPDADQWRDEAWEVIRKCPNLDFMVLTKRPELMAERMPADWGDGYSNVWLGVTVENENYLDRIDLVTEIPAPVHFVSAEPLFGPIDFRPKLDRIDWLITGCERAAKDKRRTMDMDWVRDLSSQCVEAKTAFFFKQYYEGSQLQFNGVLDGKVRHAWPLPTKPLHRRRRKPGIYRV